MEGNEQWVEIRCPRTGEPMFANLVTGECLWEAPHGASVRESTNNQWWELYDQSKGKHYYHNATTNKTVWRKPQGAEILSLTKLQEISGPKDATLNKKVKVNGVCEKLQVMGDKPVQQEAPPAIDTAEGRMSPPRHVPPQPSKRGTPPHNERTLERSSPGSDTNTLEKGSVRPPSTAISPFSIQQQHSLKPNKQGRIPPPVAHKPATLKRGAAPGTMGGLVSLNIASRGEDTPDSTTTDGREPEINKFTSPPAPPPPINMPKPFNNGAAPHSPVPVRTTKNMSASVESLSNLDSDENVFDSPVTDKSAIHDKLKQNRQETRYQSFHDFSAPSKFSEIRNKTLPVRSLDDECGLQRRHSTEIISPRHNEKNNKKGAFKSKMSSNRAPTSPTPHHNPEFAIFEKTELNRPSIYLGLKKVSIATMLAYSKDKIQKPLFFARDKELRKRAVELFKTLQNYMGDTRRGKGYSEKERLKAASELTHMGWQKPAFRDELFMQIIKQTTSNDKEKSLEHGWKLLSVYLYYFPPSMKFKNYLEGYLSKNMEACSETDKYRGQVPVGAYAEYCHDRLEKMIVRGAKPGGLKEPTLDEIRHAMKLPLKKSMFGATLEEVMDLQKDSHPTHHLPWVLTLLADKIIEFNGLEMEGIFRVPGDIDEVNALKVALDSGDHVKNFGTQDPSVCASLLKEWLRDLYDPIIPESLYNQCIEYCDHPQWTPNVIKDLPDIHRLVVTYIIRFLQRFAEKENVPKTKMTQDNLAMVFAPNLLRCPSDDPQIIYENTLKQMTFVKTLIVNLDTSYMDSVV